MTISVGPEKLFIYKGLQVAQYLLNTGEGLPKHEHIFNHSTMCVLGSCVIKKENVEIILHAKDNAIDLIANQWHEIEALEDNTIIINIE